MKRLSTLSYRIYNHCKMYRTESGLYIESIKELSFYFERKPADIRKSLAELEHAKFIEDLTIDNGKVKFFIIEY